MEWWICTYVLTIFETSVVMRFGYALKIPEKFISKMVIFTVLIWNGPVILLASEEGLPLVNSSPCSSNIQLVYLLPRLSKSFSCFYEFKIPVYDLSLPAQISETTVKADFENHFVYSEQREELYRQDHKQLTT